MATEPLCDPAPPEPAPRVFGDVHRAILEFERLRWGNPGARDKAILDRFAMTSTRYAVELGWILEQPEALAYDAQGVRRLQRLRDERRRVRVQGAGPDAGPDRGGLRPRWS